VLVTGNVSDYPEAIGTAFCSNPREFLDAWKEGLMEGKTNQASLGRMDVAGFLLQALFAVCFPTGAGPTECGACRPFFDGWSGADDARWPTPPSGGGRSGTLGLRPWPELSKSRRKPDGRRWAARLPGLRVPAGSGRGRKGLAASAPPAPPPDGSSEPQDSRDQAFRKASGSFLHGGPLHSGVMDSSCVLGSSSEP
jgi:hypothetical protein